MTSDKEEDKDKNIVIFSYTRKQAIEDGVLIDVTKMAKEAGIKYPTAITATVWEKYIVPSDELKGYGQSIEGRCWDTIWMFRVAADKDEIGEMVLFKLYYLMKPGKKPQIVTLKALCGPGDEGEPVITIMLPEED